MNVIRIMFILFLVLNLIVFNNCQQSGGSGGGGSGGGGGGDDDEPSIPLVIRSIAARSNHTVVLFKNGIVKCWGRNDYGQLGYGDINNRGDNPGEMGNNLQAVDLGAGRTAVKIAAGGYHTVVLLDNGMVKCWGMNDYGQLGYGDENNRGDNPGEMGDNLPAVDLGTGRTAVRIAAGSYHTVVLLDNGTVKCWGNNSDGKLGYGDITFRGDDPGEMGNNLLPVDLGTGRTAVKIAAGSNHTMALLDNGALKCWGDNMSGKLGYGDTNDRGVNPGEMGNNLLPVDLGTGRTAILICAGDYHSAALLDNGTLKCWGNNGSGQLGYGDTNYRGDDPGEMGNNLPITALGTSMNVVQVDTGSIHTIALSDNGAVKCWGNNSLGQLGYGDTNYRGDNVGEMGNNLLQVDLGTGIRARIIIAGGNHNAAILEDGRIKCWGDNRYGQLGYGDLEDRGDEPGEMGDDLPFVSLW